MPLRTWLSAGRPAFAGVLVGLALAQVLVMVYAGVLWRLQPGATHSVAEDAFNYLAAGERLNAGHRLYSLGVGDRPVAVEPAIYTAPLVSPPPIAVLWRPLAVFGEPAVWAWWATAAAAVALSVIVVLARAPVLGSLLVWVSAYGIGDQIAAGNVAAFFAPAVLIIWVKRDRPWIGAVIALMASFKLTPILLVAWLMGTRRWRAVAWLAAALTAIGAISLFLAGPSSFLDYLGVMRSTQPSTWSIASMSGIPWLNYALLVVFGLVAAAAGRRDGGSFAVAVAAFTLFTPAFYPAAMVTVPCLAAAILSEFSIKDGWWTRDRPIPARSAEARWAVGS